MSRAYKLHKKKSSHVRKTRNLRNLRKPTKSHINRKIRRSIKRTKRTKKTKITKRTKRTKRSMRGGGVLDNSMLGTVLSFTPFNGLMKVVNKVMGNKKSEQEDGSSQNSRSSESSGNERNINNFEVLENTIKANNHNITALKQLASSNTVDKMPDYIQHLRVINYE
tara:strand:+ start:27 stop:524 length:498 start_codon:yes stop_codon:yes gene_type:complete